jgi:hypothetical protein
MQVSVLQGVYADGAADFRQSYPVNMEPALLDSGINKGYLRPVSGLVTQSVGPGGCRGGINWNGICYRVLGSQFVSISNSGAITAIGDVGSGGRCTFDYSFERLAISSAGKLYYYDGTTLSEGPNASLGNVLDVVWVDGYFMTTDGEFLIVTELGDPMVVNPLKYGSSEIDPDPVNSVMKLRNEIYAVNRYTIEVFRNVGGQFFPFERISGAQIQKGSVGTYASCVFNETLAFVGSGRNEGISIYKGVKAQFQKIATTEVEIILSEYSQSELEAVILEPRQGPGRNHLWVRLPDRTLVYDEDASVAGGFPVWFVLTSGVEGFNQYLGVDIVYCYDKFLVANPQTGEIGYMDDTVSTQWGVDARWEFATPILYNESKGLLIYSMELVCLTGRVDPGSYPTISTSYSVDGETWSQDKFIFIGGPGDRMKRPVWFGCGFLKSWRTQRFRGTSSAFLSVARLEMAVEPLQI